MMMMLLLMMMMVAAEARLPYSVPRVNMIQRRSCYYTPFTKELTCRCTDNETNTFLKLRLMFFIKEKGQEVGVLCIHADLPQTETDDKVMQKHCCCCCDCGSHISIYF